MKRLQVDIVIASVNQLGNIRPIIGDSADQHDIRVLVLDGGDQKLRKITASYSLASFTSSLARAHESKAIAARLEKIVSEFLKVYGTSDLEIRF